MSKEELLRKLDEATSMEELEAIKSEMRILEEAEEVKEEVETEVAEEVTEVPTETTEKKTEEAEITPAEERNLLKETSVEIEVRNADGLKIKEERKMEERKFTTSSPEYRSAWAKTLMGVELDETEKRAVGDAIGTTATEFVKADETHNGVNNFGLMIPETVRMDFLKLAEESSPIYRDIRKLNIKGNLDFPYLFGADDAKWYTETVDTDNEGIELKNIKLTGHELAKDIEITWKAESMTVEGFISFLLDELNEKMNKALINAVIYGNGNAQPTGIVDGLVAKEDTKAIDLIKTCLGALKNEDRIGAKVYVAQNIADEISFYKDENGNYPYLVAGLGRAGGATIEADPYLHENEIVVGNGRNYVLNFSESLRIDKEVKVKPRRVLYGGYLIADGNKKPGAFVYGKVVESI